MVHAILNSWRWGGQLEYLIDWEGYSPDERSWVPQDDILDPPLLTEFHTSHPDQPTQRGRVPVIGHCGHRDLGGGGYWVFSQIQWQTLQLHLLVHSHPNTNLLHLFILIKDSDIYSPVSTHLLSGLVIHYDVWTYPSVYLYLDTYLLRSSSSALLHQVALSHKLH